MRRNRNQAGLTLTELLVAAGMIGLLASLAIPGFVSYQARARRSEAYTNVGAIARAEKSYFAEQDIYFEAPAHPITDKNLLGAQSHTWTAAAENDYAELGWEPEGKVRYSYDVNTGSTACSCNDACFTATAYGDVDENDAIAAIVFVEKGVDPGSGSVVTCPPHLFGLGVPAGPEGELILHPLTDQF